MSSGQSLNETMTAIKKHVHLADLLRPHIKLKQEHGSIYYGHCPFHEKQRNEPPEFAVNINKGIYYCFSCHEAGDAISFVANYFKKTTVEAVDFLIQEFDLQDKMPPKKTILKVVNG